MTRIGIDNTSLLRAAGRRLSLAIDRATNDAGLKARAEMRRVLVEQTPLAVRMVNRAVQSRRAAGDGVFTISARGDGGRLTLPGVQSSRAGAPVAPWNKRRVPAGAFMTRSSQADDRPRQTGERVAQDMVTGRAEAAFYSVASRELPDHLAQELSRILGD